MREEKPDYNPFENLITKKPVTHKATFLDTILGISIIVGPIAVVLFLVSKLFSGIGSSACDRDHPDYANYMAREYVEERLKSPSSASFSDRNDTEAYVTNVLPDSCIYTVRGWVDADNSFGANIRNDYNVSMKFNMNTRSYTLESISVSPK